MSELDRAEDAYRRAAGGSPEPGFNRSPVPEVLEP
jgi:hypothetical protein